MLSIAAHAYDLVAVQLDDDAAHRGADAAKAPFSSGCLR
jgi:hypothetical protein